MKSSETGTLKGIDMFKSWPGPGQKCNLYCTRQLRRIQFHCVAKETKDFMGVSMAYL